MVAEGFMRAMSFRDGSEAARLGEPGCLISFRYRFYGEQSPSVYWHGA